MPASLVGIKSLLVDPAFVRKTLGRGAIASIFGRGRGHGKCGTCSRGKGMQFPIYYVSKSLLSAETNYSHLEKLASTLVEVAHKLSPYLQCHPIAIVTAYPL